MKKRGFGKGKYNGFGGKQNSEETIEQAAIRELFEEVGIKTSIHKIRKMGELTFNFPFAQDKNWDQIVHVFLVDNYEGQPKETEEMSYRWFDLDKIPFNQMWDDDKYWLNHVLNGRKIKGNFSFDKDNESILTKEIRDF